VSFTDSERAARPAVALAAATGRISAQAITSISGFGEAAPLAAVTFFCFQLSLRAWRQQARRFV
jgi:hypothetical protein